MKYLLVFLCTTACACAQPRIRLHEQTCRQAREAVQHSGSLVVQTGEYTFDRYVANGRYCAWSEVARPAWGRTRDDDACPFARLCADISRGSGP